MTTLRGRLGLSLTLAATLTSALRGLADWDEGGSCKMHWPQMPDLTPNGMDVNASQPYVLADDFRCVQSGPITNIHIWGSWWHDNIDPNVTFILSIHADIPADPQGGYSMPSNPPLWEATFPPGAYQMRVWTSSIAEGWFEPPGSYEPPPADTVCFQYNFPIDPQAGFVQTSGTIYWLNVQAKPLEHGRYFGWKTSTNSWNDDAVFSFDGGPWQELRYPPQHPYAGHSIDLAFVIEGLQEIPEELPECPKWLQPPDCDIGLDVESWMLEEGMVGTPIVADDWLCDGRPITAIRWWGSYLGWQANNPNPEPPPFASRPLGFLLKWYLNNPSNQWGFSEPATIILTNFYRLAAFGSQTPGMVWENTQCVSHLDIIQPGLVEHEYVYYVRLTNEWNEKEGNVYWLSIQAVYLAVPEYHWGWKTTPVPWNWNDDAVFQVGMPIWTNMRYPPPGWEWVTNHPYAGESVNMSFELLTDICPARCKKWQQPPDMVTGINAPSWTVNDTNFVGAPLRADDFVSDGRPITDIHWWGSYIGWESTVPGGPTNPVPPPTGVNGPMGFVLSWHVSDPLAGCAPGADLGRVFISISNCHETYYGTVFQYWRIPPRFEHEYQYYVDFLDPDLDLDPCFETNGVRYWIDIQAVFSTNFLMQPGGAPHQGWGWKITPSTNLCPSAVTWAFNPAWTNEVLGQLDTLHPRSNEYFDLSFELTTTEIGTNTNNVVNVVFTNMARSAWPGNPLLMLSTGYCGCGKQVLQASASLGGDGPPQNWVDIQTNLAPRQQNLWTAARDATQKFYRVIQVP